MKKLKLIYKTYRMRFLIAGYALAVIGLFGAGFMKGQEYQKDKSEKAATKGVENHAEIEAEIMVLPDTDLDKRLSKWMRD